MITLKELLCQSKHFSLFLAAALALSLTSINAKAQCPTSVVASGLTASAQDKPGQPVSLPCNQHENRKPESGEAADSFRESDSKPLHKRTPFDLSRINEEVVKEFDKVWRSSGNGTSRVEGAILIFCKLDGSYMARSQGCANQARKFTLKWHPNAIAIVHTHPNNQDAMPAPQDERVAERYGVPIFTITNRGMFMYDPAARKTSKVMERLDWLDASRWEQKAWPLPRSSRRAR